MGGMVAIESRRIVVLGAGAMGSLYGCVLAGAGHDVTMLCRSGRQAQSIAEQGLAVSAPAGGLRVFRPAATTDPAGIGVVDLVLVCCKAYDTGTASASLPPLVGADTVVLTLQNGLGSVEALCQRVPPGQVVAGITYQGAYVSGPGRVDHAGSGPTIIGELDGRVTDRIRALAATLADAGLPTEVSGNIRGLQWFKLLVNAAINPLTAVLRVTNGRLLELPEAVSIMRQAVAEGEAVARAAGVQLPLDEDGIWAQVTDVARATAANRSSMLQDAVNGRRTEVDSISGVIVREGRRLGIATPVNETLCNLVRCSDPARQSE